MINEKLRKEEKNLKRKKKTFELNKFIKKTKMSFYTFKTEKFSISHI